MVLWQVALGVAFLLAWQGVSGRLVDNFFISNPIDVVRRLWAGCWMARFSCICGRLCTRRLRLYYRVGTGAVLGLWLGVSPFAGRLLNPYLYALNALPKVALAPLFVLWFGLGIDSKIALAAVLVLFLVFLNTFAGVREVDRI